MSRPWGLFLIWCPGHGVSELRERKKGTGQRTALSFARSSTFVRGQLFQNLNLIKGKKYFHSKIFQ